MAATSDAPIFFIGMPRSGTTFVFEAFARHESLAWPTLFTQRAPTFPSLNLWRTMVDNRFFQLAGRKGQYGRTRLGNRYLPQPNEAYRFWNRVASAAFARSFMDEQHVSDADRERARKAIGRIMFWQRRARFAAKFTGPPRIRFLSALFPGATFVHVVRDGRAVVQSLLQVPFWREKGGYNGPFWQDSVSAERLNIWKNDGGDPAVLAAMQWQRIIRAARSEAAALDPSQYFEVRYEDVVAAPVTQINDIARRCGLAASVQMENYLRDIPRVDNFNEKYRREFTPQRITKITEVMQPELGLLGYG